MPVTSVTKDPEALTMTVVADFAAPLERLWEAYVDPRQIERFWGPPGWPATFLRHDAAPGGRSAYTMTGPDGEVARCYWDWVAVEPYRSFEIRDGLGEDATGHGTGLARMVFVFEATATGSRVTTTSWFAGDDALATKVEFEGAEAGTRAAMAQIDDVLVDLRSFAKDIPTHAQVLSDTQVRISRVIKGTQEQVWRAHHERALLQRWLLGPDGWAMPVCEVATRPGETYRYEWANGTDHFGFTGECLEWSAPRRSVTTERSIGLLGDLPGSVNELTLTPVAAGTLLSLMITYTSAEVRDRVLATGMTDGMETSYRRLESELLTPA